MASAALQAFRQKITVHWPQQQEKLARAHLIKTAREGIAKITGQQTARASIPPEVEVYANTPGNSNLESVKLPGPIVALFRYRREIAFTTFRALYMASPVVSGLYRESHTFFVNGVAIDGPSDLLSVKATDELTIANPVAYARRLEIGKTTSGRDFTVPNRIYETVARAMQAKYRNVATVRFGYYTIPGAYNVRGKLPTHYMAKGNATGKLWRRKRDQGKARRALRAPAIFIEVSR